MSNENLTLAALDADGAIRESAAEAAGDTRAGFLAQAGLRGGGAFGIAALSGADLASAATSSRDISILNYALTLEYLEAAFYTEAEKNGVLEDELAYFARLVGAHERAHVKGLKAVLGSKAVKKPKFDFQGTTEDAAKFLDTAVVLEATGVSAYAGQAPRVKSRKILEAALAIHTVEARHASWARQLAGAKGAPDAFDKPLTMKQVLKAVGKTGFIKG